MSFLQIPIGTYPNTFLGYEALQNVVVNPPTTGINNTAFGFNALKSTTSGFNNTAFGHLALSSLVTGNNNTALGNQAMGNSVSGSINVAIGAGALKSVSGQYNTGIGVDVGGFSIVSGDLNTFIGCGSGSDMTTGSRNVILGGFRGFGGGAPDIRTLSNYIVLSDGSGNPRLWIDNTGAVNIPGGTVLPGGVANGVLYLNASKVVTSGSGLTFDGASALGLKSNNASTFAYFDVGRTASDARTAVAAAVNDFLTGTAAGDALFYKVSAGNVFYGTAGAGAAIFTINNSEQMRLTSTGLGIGTSSPAAKLDVIQNTNGDTQIRLVNADAGASARAQVSVNAQTAIGLLSVNNDSYAGAAGTGRATGMGLFTSSGTTGGIAIGARAAAGVITFHSGGDTERMRLDSSGNLGLGTTPSAWNSAERALDIGNTGALVRGGSAELRLMYNAFVNTSSQYTYKTTGPASQYQQTGGQHQWYIATSGTAGNAISFTQAMTLDASGNLGIGTTSPASAIHAQRASGAAIYLQLAQTGIASWQIGMSGSSNGLAFLQSGSEKIRIKETGQLRFVPLSSDPAGAEAGDVYYNSGTNKLRLYDGSTWVDLN